MRPRAHHQAIERVRVILFDFAIDIERAVKIFRVVPATYGHHIGFYVFEVWQDRTALPELVVVGMFDELLPEKVVFAVVLIGITERTKHRIELPSVL